MINPLIKSGRGILIYSLVWIAVIGIHMAVLLLLLDAPAGLSIAKAIISNTLLSIIGVCIWFFVKFNPFDINRISRILAFNFSAAIVLLAIWMFISNMLLFIIVEDKGAYQSHFASQWPAELLYGFFMYAFFVLLYYFMINYENLKERIQNQSQLESLVKDAELTALKSQINPHFLFNSLNSINALTMSDPEKAQEMVVKLSAFFRYSLAGNKKELNPVHEEIENGLLYLEIEKVRFGSRLNISSDISDTCQDILVPSMILQPLLENAVKHGVYEITGEVFIELKVYKQDLACVLEISNSVDSEAVPRKGTGTGLQNVRSRLNLIYEKFDLLVISKSDKRFSVKVVIPSKNAENQNINN